MERQELVERGRRGARRIWRALRRPAKWAAAALAVGVVVPAATKQWTDAQQQRELKAELTSALAAAATQATTDGGFVLADHKLGWKSAEIRAAYREVLRTWKKDAAAIDGQIVAYFAKTRDPDRDALVRAVRDYTRVVENYLYYGLVPRQSALSDYDLNFEKLRDDADLDRESGNAVPAIVRAHTMEDGFEPAFMDAAQNEWAQNIVNASGPLIVMIRERQPNGLEVGAGPFVRQLLPFV
jgi:hypothetical protein